MRNKATLLGFPVDLVDLKGALDIAREFLASGDMHHIITLNPEMIIFARRSSDLQQALMGADAYLPETAGVAWALGVKKLPGIDFMYELLKLASLEGYSVYFVGSKPGVADNAASEAARRYPELKVVGTHHGYFNEEEESLVAEIAMRDPDILLVGMGTVSQETFIHRHKEALGSRVIMGVGGSFDVLSGQIKRAPEFFRRSNLEWFYRLITQPRRLRRMACTLPHFVLLVLWERIKLRSDKATK
ncbi:MAG: WecB/TagA/CpsF family glycosyltransferase [Actinobacteria bacterium]|nr:WecB/TagA/CpsF family glycosyltransferase [Actinomycetota bacterium]